MAETTGFVQELKWDVADAAVIALIGDDPGNAEAFKIVISPADSDAALSAKRAMGRLLAQATLRGWEVLCHLPGRRPGAVQRRGTRLRRGPGFRGA